jgi:hypothetical protein
MNSSISFAMAAAALLCLAACTKEDTAAPAKPVGASDSPIRITATIQDLMDAEIDPAADFLWGSVGFVSTKDGTEDKRPRTDKDWDTVRNQAIILIEATNLLVLPGRIVATAGSKLDPSEVAGIEDPKDIQKAIDAAQPSFVALAHGLYDAAAEILKAIDAKDVARMDAAGEKLDAACEACHRAFWYPNAPEPTQVYNGKRIGVN